MTDMHVLPGPPLCGFCEDEYEPHDHPDYQGFCGQTCKLDQEAVERDA
jgi:hypothetical protein